MGEHKILITGGSGKFATAFKQEYSCNTPPKQELDVTNYLEIRDYLKNHNEISIIIHAGALTSVTKCEMEKQLAYNVNVNGTRNLIGAIQEINKSRLSSNNKIKLIYMSTPCVFDGKTGNYDEDTLPQPENFYGETKYISEEMIKSSGLKYLIIRANFVTKEKWAYDKAFTDRFGTYLFIDQVVKKMTFHINNSEGIVHIIGNKKLSMFEVAKITTPDIKPLTLKQFYKNMEHVARVPKLTVDMTMTSKRTSLEIEIDRD